MTLAKNSKVVVVRSTLPRSSVALATQPYQVAKATELVRERRAMNQTHRDTERGAVFIHVAIGLLVILAFSAFVADYGMLWVSRSQAQNSADAGALAGAAALAFDIDAPDRWDRARNVAWNTSIRNRVWGDEPGAVPTSPYYGAPCSARNPQACIRVDVYRNGTNGGATIPTWFANLFGTSSQGVRAMAVAETAPASGSNCMKPWLIPDR